MNVASFIARRIAFQNHHSFSGFIIRLSVVATMVSVAIMIITLALVAGFQQTIANKVFSFWGHIRVQQAPPSVSGLAEELPSRLNDTIIRAIKGQPEVKWSDVYATKSALLKSRESIEGVLLKGVDASFHKERLLPFLKKGNWLPFDTSRHSVVISEYTARQLQLSVGGKAYLYFIDQAGTSPRVRPVTIAGIYKTSIEEYDKSFVLVDLRLIQGINGWSADQVGGYELTLDDYTLDNQVSNRLLDEIPSSWYSTPVREIYPNIFDWLQLQNINRQIIIVIMCVVAVINLISCLLILVLERSKMIGLLKALGAADKQVHQIFWQQGLLIAGFGIVLGNLMGLGLCYLQLHTGFIRLDEAAYYVAQAPVKIIWWQVLLVDVFTFVVCFLVLLLPSLLVRNIKPVSALRFE